MSKKPKQAPADDTNAAPAEQVTLTPIETAVAKTETSSDADSSAGEDGSASEGDSSGDSDPEPATDTTTPVSTIDTIVSAAPINGTPTEAGAGDLSVGDLKEKKEVVAPPAPVEDEFEGEGEVVVDVQLAKEIQKAREEGATAASESKSRDEGKYRLEGLTADDVRQPLLHKCWLDGFDRALSLLDKPAEPPSAETADSA